MKKKIIALLILSFLIGYATDNQCKDCSKKPQLPPAPIGQVKDFSSYYGKTANQSCAITLYVVGRGAPPLDSTLSEIQKYLLSERAAIADGYRLLSEKLQGVFVDAYTKAGYYAVDYDRIHLATSAFIKGSEIISLKHKDNGVCEAEMKITVAKEQLCCYLPQIVANYVNTCKNCGKQ